MKAKKRKTEEKRNNEEPGCKMLYVSAMHVPQVKGVCVYRVVYECMCVGQEKQRENFFIFLRVELCKKTIRGRTPYTILYVFSWNKRTGTGQNKR